MRCTNRACRVSGIRTCQIMCIPHRECTVDGLHVGGHTRREGYQLRATQGCGVNLRPNSIKQANTSPLTSTSRLMINDQRRQSFLLTIARRHSQSFKNGFTYLSLSGCTQQNTPFYHPVHISQVCPSFFLRIHIHLRLSFHRVPTHSCPCQTISP